MKSRLPPPPGKQHYAAEPVRIHRETMQAGWLAGWLASWLAAILYKLHTFPKVAQKPRNTRRSTPPPPPSLIAKEDLLFYGVVVFCPPSLPINLPRAVRNQAGGCVPTCFCSIWFSSVKRHTKRTAQRAHAQHQPWTTKQTNNLKPIKTMQDATPRLCRARSLGLFSRELSVIGTPCRFEPRRATRRNRQKVRIPTNTVGTTCASTIHHVFATTAHAFTTIVLFDNLRAPTGGLRIQPPPDC